MQGEKLARKLLRRAGLKIITTNYRCQYGEADIVALDKTTHRSAGAETLVFVEVKTRSGGIVAPQTAVDEGRQTRLRNLARHYVRQYAPSLLHRFDIVAITWPAGQEPKVEHIKDAFT